MPVHCLRVCLLMLFVASKVVGISGSTTLHVSADGPCDVFRADHRLKLDCTSLSVSILNIDFDHTEVAIVSDEITGFITIGQAQDGTQSERFVLPPHKEVTLPLNLMLTKMSKAYAFPKLKVPLVQDLVVCAALVEAFSTEDGSVVFAVDSDTSHLFAEYSISYWLGLCGIKAPVVHTYQNRNEYHLSKPEYNYTDSYCTVRSISGLTVPHRDKSAIDGFNCLPIATGCIKPTCLEDFMNYQVVSSLCSRHSGERYAGYDECMDSAAGAWNHSAADDSRDTCNDTTSSAFNNITSTSGNGRLHFFTSWGLMQLVNSVCGGTGTGTTVGHYTDAYSAYNSMVHGELLEVLRAFAGSEYATSLVVHSLPSGYVSSAAASVNTSKAKQPTPYSRLLMKLLLVYDTDEAPAAALNIALQALQARIAADLDSASYTETVSGAVLRAAPLLDALMLLFGTEFKKFHNTCRISADGVASQNYICRHRSARQQLADCILSVVQQLQTHTRLAQYFVHFAVDILTVHDYSDGIAVATAVQGNNLAATTLSKQDRRPIPPVVSVQMDGGVDVLIFVRPEHLRIAQRLVYHWQRHNEAQGVYFLYLKFLIFPISGTDTGGKGDFYTRKPALGAVLSVVAEKVAQVCSVKDVVYVLVGLQAVLAFPQPGRLKPAEEAHLQALCREGKLQRDPNVCDIPTFETKFDSHADDAGCQLCNSGALYDECEYIKGVIPAVGYDEIGHFRLDANIVFAAATSVPYHDHASNQEEGEWMDVNAFVGVGYKVLDMINEVRSDPRYSISGHGSNAEGSGPQQSPVPVEHLLREYVDLHPADITVDCQQRAFHSTKSARLIGLLSLGAHSTDAHSNHRSEGISDNHSIETMLQLVKAAVLEDERQSFRKYSSDMSTLLDAYLWTDTEHFTAVLATLQYQEVIASRLVKLPSFASVRRTSQDGKQCIVDVVGLVKIKSYINVEVYQQHDHLLAAVLAVAGALHQLVVCECTEYLQFTIDELVYIYSRIGILSKHSTFKIDFLEYELASALLETYEQRLIHVGNGSDYNVSAHNANDWSRYSNMSELHRDQVLAAVRFALSGMKQELGVYPDMVAQMDRSLGASPYKAVKQRRVLWHTQRQALATALLNTQDTPSSSTTTVETTSSGVPETPALHLTAQASHTASYSGPRTHYVTYASEHTEGLQNLLDSAVLAGIHIEVLGLGQPYRDYSSKTDTYLNYLINGTRTTTGDAATNTNTNTNTNTAVSEDDVVLLMDAYDVLVFPSIQRAASVLAQAPSPLLFCAERGIYGEITTGFFYPRGAPDGYTPKHNDTNNSTLNAFDREDPRRHHYNPGGYMGTSADGTESSIYYAADSQKFLNSGCMLGRAGQMVDMLRYTKKYGRTFRDDQLMIVRYMLAHPDTISLDIGSTLFSTNFKATSSAIELRVLPDLKLLQNEADIGLLHCNHISSGSAYASILYLLREYNQSFYQGADGPLLLRALQHLSTGRKEEAARLLQDEVVVVNCTTMGGTNPIRSYILSRISE